MDAFPNASKRTWAYTIRRRIVEWISVVEPNVEDRPNEWVDSDFSLEFVLLKLALSNELFEWLLTCSSLQWHEISREPSPQMALMLPHLSHCRSFFMINQFLPRVDVLSHCCNLDIFHFRSSQFDFSAWCAFGILIADATECEKFVFHLLSPQVLLSETSSKLLYWFRRSNSTVPGDFCGHKQKPQLINMRMPMAIIQFHLNTEWRNEKLPVIWMHF